MVKITNTLNGGAAGTNVTRASTGLSGDEISHLIIDNSATNNGNSMVQYSADLAGLGVPISVRTPGVQNTYLRYDISGVTGTRFVTRRGFYLPEEYTGYSGHGLLIVRLTEAHTSSVSINLNFSRPRIYIASSSAPGAVFGPALPTGQILWAELAVTPASADGAADGVAAYRITDDSGNEIAADTMTGLDILSTPPARYHFGGAPTNAEDIGDYLWDIQAGPLESGWWGPIGATEILATPNITLVSDTPASSASNTDREITVSWPAVPNATGYRALVATRGGTDYTVVSESVSSPYTFTGLSGAARRVAIQAKGE